MAADILAWNNETLSDTTLDKVTHGSGVADPAVFPTGRPFYRTDLKLWKVTTDGGTTWEFISFGFVAEASSTPVADDGLTSLASGAIRLGNQITLPTTEEFYKITAVEWKNSTTITGNLIGGVALIDADPPVNVGFLTIAQTPSTAQSGSGSLQKVNVDSGILVKGGTKVTGFIVADNGTATFRRLGVSSRNVGFNITYGQVPPVSVATWLTSTVQLYVKIYFQGVT